MTSKNFFPVIEPSIVCDALMPCRRRSVQQRGHRRQDCTVIDQSEDNFDRVMSVNAKGVFLCLKYEIAQMLKNGGGAIVNLASVAGLVGFPGLGPYVASKHAINGLTKNAALEYSRQGIGVNSVCPGGIETRMLNSLVAQASGGRTTTREMMDPLHPVGHIGRPSEVAELIVWLCSSHASFVSGANVPIDGGFVARSP